MTEVGFAEANGLRHGYLEAGDGPLVLLLHGFPDHAPTFRHQMPALAEAGYRAVAPYLRGYAPTDPAPDGCYMTCAAADDAAGLIDVLGGGRAHVVGHDWGAAVGYGLAARYPSKVASLVTMAVPHPVGVVGGFLRGEYGQLRRSWYVFFFQLEGVAEPAARRDGFRLLDRLWEDWSPGYRRRPDEKAALDALFSRPGVLEAALGWYRAAVNPLRQDPRRAADQLAMVGPVPVETLCIFGADDGCVSPSLTRGMEAFFPAGLRVEILEGAGHFCHLERPDVVNRLVLERLSRSGSPSSASPDDTLARRPH